MKIIDVIKTLSDAGIYVFLDAGKLKTRSAENALTTDLVELIKNNKPGIMDYLLRYENINKYSEDEITPYEGDELPLSFSQQRFWLMDQIESNVGQRNISAVLKLSGVIDIVVLNKVFLSLIQRHEILSTRFKYDEQGGPIQINYQVDDFFVPMEDLSELSTDESEQALVNVINKEVSQLFDLTSDLMLRVRLLKVKSNQHYLTVVIHHIASDGWSIGILINEFAQLYNAYIQEQANPLVPLSIKYADYAHWQRKQIEKKKAAALAFWRSELEGAAEAIDLPVDRIVNNNFSEAGVSTLHIERNIVAQLKKRLFENNGTLFSGLFACLNILLGKWCAQQDMVIGVVDAGREIKEIENVFGCFINTLAIREKIRDDISVDTYLSKVCSHFLEIAEHKYFPFDLVVQDINPGRGASASPFFNVAFLLQNYANYDWQIKDLHVEVMPPLVNKVFLDLHFVAHESKDGLIIECEYRKDLFSYRTIQLLLESYHLIVNQLIAYPERTVGALQISNELMFQAQNSRAQKKQIYAVGTFTIDPLFDCFLFLREKLSLDVTLEVLPYQQVFEQLLNTESEFGRNKNGFNIICLSLQDWFGSGSFVDQEKNIKEMVDRFCVALDEAQKKSPVLQVVMICPSDIKVFKDIALLNVIEEQQQKIAEAFKGCSKVKVLMPGDLKNNYDDSHFDFDTYQLAHIPYVPAFYSGLMCQALRAFNAHVSKPYKVIVLDCDNTLWGGVCAEEGSLGISVSDGYLYLQKFMVDLQAKGFLLCLCSRNEEADVWDVFEKNKGMYLERKHIVSSRINWEPKWKNIRSIAEELNLGLDSIVFIDDDLVQCLEMQMHCPQVLTIQVPHNINDIPDVLRNIWAFDVGQSASVVNRTMLYEQQKLRQNFSESYQGKRQEFLASLGVHIHVQQLCDDNCERAIELLVRTNQFNLNSYQINKSDLLGALNSQIFGVIAHVEDRFGDYGLVGLALFTLDNNCFSVLNMVLSCRALGRGVEYEILKSVSNLAVEQGAETIELSFVPSSRNTPAFDFLKQVCKSINYYDVSAFSIQGKSTYRLNARDIQNLDYLHILNAEDLVQKKSISEPAVSIETQVYSSGGWLLPVHHNQIYAWLNNFCEFHTDVESFVRLNASLKRASAQQNYLAPSTPTEKELCELWQAVLGSEQIGVNDNFFQLGGNSLLATRLIAKINRHFGVNLKLSLLFEAQSIHDLAVLIENNTILARMTLNQDDALLPDEVELTI